MLVAIDIGGTFTDLMAFDEATGRFALAKSLTTPAQLVQGIIDCLRKSGVDCAAISELIHGSTTAINTLIERKGAKTGLIVTRGTRDVYFIGRGNETPRADDEAHAHPDQHQAERLPLEDQEEAVDQSIEHVGRMLR